MAKTAKGSKKKTRIDFGDVEKDIRQRGRTVPEGTYIGKISAVKKDKKEGSAAPYFRWTIQIVSDDRGKTKHKGVPVYHITSLKREALFNLRNLIYAASNGKKNVAGKAIDFDPQSLIGSKLGVIVEHEEYKPDGSKEARIRNRIADLLPLKDVEVDEEEDEEEGADDSDNEDDEEEDDDEDDEDEDEEEEDDDEDDDDLDEVDVDEDL